MANADKRTVHTDALETLGTIIGPDEKRDAIHLAVLPAVAGEPLRPGQDVGVFDGKAHGEHRGETRGIVDPFLRRMVCAGERFWLVVYPRQITSLRHVWTHPAFPEAAESGESASAEPNGPTGPAAPIEPISPVAAPAAVPVLVAGETPPIWPDLDYDDGCDAMRCRS